MVNYPRARAHPRCEVSSQGVPHHHFVHASSRPARQWRKLCHTTKLTDSQPRCQVSACSVVACSTHFSCCRERMLRTRPRTGLCEHLMPDVVVSKVHQNNCSYVSSVDLHSDSLRKNLAWWAVTRRTLKNHKTVKIGGGCLLGYGHLLGTIQQKYQ